MRDSVRKLVTTGAFVALVVAAGRADAALSGDCDGNGEVGVGDLVVAMEIAIGAADLGQCASLAGQDNSISVAELLAALNQALPPPASGQRIVYSPGILDPHLFIINIDGSGKTKITTSVGIDSAPAWSPDGTKVAFSTPDADNHHVLIGIVNADGSNQHIINVDGTIDSFPAWSPDGTKIVFTAGGGDAIDIMNADGFDRHRLVTKTGGEIYGHLSWSPNGTRIAFESTRPRQRGSEDRFEIWTMNPDGSDLTRLTTNDFPDQHPAWNPNGANIAFAAKRSVFSVKNIFLINPDGSSEVQLTHLFGDTPAWSHDGQQIAYSSSFGIVVANANASNPTTVPGTIAVMDFDFK